MRRIRLLWAGLLAAGGATSSPGRGGGVGSERTPNLAGLSADSWPDRQLGIDRQP